MPQEVQKLAAVEADQPSPEKGRGNQRVQEDPRDQVDHDFQGLSSISEGRTSDKTWQVCLTDRPNATPF